MENILDKDIFNESDLDKLSPDYKPRNFVLRMQMRRTLAKDSHSHGILKNTSFTRKSLRTKESFAIHKEIVKLRNEFNNIDLKNRVSLKGLEPLKLKSTVTNDESSIFDKNLNLHHGDDNFSINELTEEFTELEIRNDNEFKVNPKIKPLKHIKIYRETQCYRKPKNRNSGLLDLPKDINENNEDIFRVECKNKSRSPHNLDHDTHTEPPVMKQDLHRNNTSNNLDVPVSELQNLLIMMAISSKPNEVEDHHEEVEISNEVDTPKSEIHSNVDVNDKRSVCSEGIDNILSITPIRVQIDSKETYLMKKYINKWKSYVKHNREKYVSEQRQETLNNFFEKIAKKKMAINQGAEADNKSKILLRDYNSYQHRYKLQKHIIALQKAKLEEQNRLIEELKYNRIVEASRQSVDDMKEEVRKTNYEIDRHLKPKIKCLTNELQIPEIEEPSLILHCLKVPQFLQRMEKRAREREEKHAMIRERRRQMEEERIRMKQQAELAKAEMDKEEKMKRIQELREKRRKEKIEHIRKKQWASRLRALIVMADLHYEKTLKAKYGIRPFRILIEMKRDNIEKAKAHYIFQLKNNFFLHWLWHTEDMWMERNFKAENFWRKKLLRKVFDAFKRNHHGLVLKKQVADDYYDLYLTQMAFRLFREGINVIRKETEIKWQIAVSYHSRSEMILQETSNTKRICFSNISDIKIDIEIDTDFKPILPAMDNFYQKLVETGTNTLSYNDTLIKKIENPIEDYNESNTLSVGEFLNSIKNESDNDCDYQAYEIGADDYYSESDSNYSNNEIEKKKKKNKKKSKHNGWKNSPTERPRKDGPQTVLEKPLKPKYIEDLRLVRAEPEVKPKRNRVKKPRTSKLKVCPYCGKLSKTMDYHILIHTAERKFKCDQCGSAFFTLSVLNSHMKRHTAVKKFKCDQCIAAFANERELRSHNIMHQDEKKYVCNICNKSFKRKPILKRHMMIHNFGSKPIQCELCPMTFITKYNLRHHMRVHTGERPFKCEICSQPYSYKHDFNRHCLKKHGVFLKRRSVRVMNEEVLQQERALMRELSLRAHGIIKEDEVKNPFDGPQAAQAYEQAMKAIAANKIPIIF